MLIKCYVKSEERELENSRHTKDVVVDISDTPKEGYKESYIFCKVHLEELVDAVKDGCYLSSYGDSVELEKDFNLNSWIKGHGIEVE